MRKTEARIGLGVQQRDLVIRSQPGGVHLIEETPGHQFETFTLPSGGTIGGASETTVHEWLFIPSELIPLVIDALVAARIAAAEPEGESS